MSSSIQSFEQLLQAKLSQSRPSTATHTIAPHDFSDDSNSAIDDTSLSEFAELEAKLHAELSDTVQPKSGNIFSQLVSEYESTFDDDDDAPSHTAYAHPSASQHAHHAGAHAQQQHDDDEHQGDGDEEQLDDDGNEIPNLSTIIEEDTEHTPPHADYTDIYDHNADGNSAINMADAAIVPSNLVQKYFLGGNDKKLHSRSNSASNKLATQPPITITETAAPAHINEQKDEYSADVVDKMKLLEREILRYKSETAKLKHLQNEEAIELNFIRSECEQTKQRLAAERAAFEQYKEEEQKRLKRQSVELLTKQRKTSQQPERNERKQIDTLNAEIESLRQQLKQTEDKNKAKMLALKKSCDVLQNENVMLKSELTELQKTRFSHVPSAASTQPPKTAPQQTPSKSAAPTTATVRRTSQSNGVAKHAWAASPHKTVRPTSAASSASSEHRQQAQQQHIITAPAPAPAPAKPSAKSNSGIQPTGKVVQEIEHAGGKREHVYADGARVIEFPNGTSKHILPSGETVVQFVNGDNKRIFANGDVLYYYHSVNTTHLTEKTGCQFYRFDNGQIEKHGVDGEKWIYYVDQTVKHILTDGTEQIRPIRSASEIPQF